MITLPKSISNTACEVCPIKGTEYCHKVNLNAPKYTRAEKKELAEKLKTTNTTAQQGKG